MIITRRDKHSPNNIPVIKPMFSKLTEELGNPVFTHTNIKITSLISSKLFINFSSYTKIMWLDTLLQNYLMAKF